MNHVGRVLLAPLVLSDRPIELYDLRDAVTARRAAPTLVETAARSRSATADGAAAVVAPRFFTGIWFEACCCAPLDLPPRRCLARSTHGARLGPASSHGTSVVARWTSRLSRRVGRGCGVAGSL